MSPGSVPGAGVSTEPTGAHCMELEEHGPRHRPHSHPPHKLPRASVPVGPPSLDSVGLKAPHPGPALPSLTRAPFPRPTSPLPLSPGAHILYSVHSLGFEPKFNVVTYSCRRQDPPSLIRQTGHSKISS